MRQVAAFPTCRSVRLVCVSCCATCSRTFAELLSPSPTQQPTFRGFTVERLNKTTASTALTSASEESVVVFIELDVPIEQLTLSAINTAKEFIATILSGVQATNVLVELIPGSTIVRITFSRQTQPISNLEVEQVLEALRSPGLQNAMPNISVMHVAAQLPPLESWTDWFYGSPSKDGNEVLIDTILSATPPVCLTPPTAVYCQTVRGMPSQLANESLQLPCSLAAGGIRCRAKDNPWNECSSYRMRLKCLTPCRADVCSGHGVCADSHTRDCRCFGGWLPPNCAAEAMTVAITADPNECQGAPAAISQPSILPGLQIVRCLPNRTRWNHDSFVVIRLRAAPVSSVTCSLRTNRSDLVQFGEDTAILSEERLLANVSIFGAVDVESNDGQPFSVTVHCSSEDIRFDGAEQTVSAQNEDVPFISATAIRPVGGTIPLDGGPVEIFGKYFNHPNLTVTVDGVEVSGPKVFRTILINEAAGRMYEVFFEDADGLRWESLADAAYLVSTATNQSINATHANATHANATHPQAVSRARRKAKGGGGGKAGGGGASFGGAASIGGGAGVGNGGSGGTGTNAVFGGGPGVGAGGARLDAAGGGGSFAVGSFTADKTWYSQLLEAKQNELDTAGEGRLANDTHADGPIPPDLLNMTRKALDNNHAVFNISGLRFGALLPRGSLSDRIVLAAAWVEDAKNEPLVLVREYVQPYDFFIETDGSAVYFVTPAKQPDDPIESYADVLIGSSDEGVEASPCRFEPVLIRLC